LEPKRQQKKEFGRPTILIIKMPTPVYSSSAGGAGISSAKAKTHWFKNLDLTSVLDPSIDDGVFTGLLSFTTIVSHDGA
jgi:hypothetical protein